MPHTWKMSMTYLKTTTTNSVFLRIKNEKVGKRPDSQATFVRNNLKEGRKVLAKLESKSLKNLFLKIM